MQPTDPALAFWLPICSLIVAALAIVVAPFVSWQVAKRQAKTSLIVAQKQVIAPMRQKWIDSLRDRVAEFLSTAHWYYVAGGDQVIPSPDDEDKFEEHESLQIQQVDRKMVFMLNQIDMMLNPKEADHIALMDALNRVRRGCFQQNEPGRRHIFVPDLVDEARGLCKTVLKREWDRLKKET
ncbi:hypothetical protein [Rugamonas aquatica]|uniref:DUF4760 domain-containing protein n=1 Tax=Rugamonas aquatica TaxID=2743357 RepID=A0A6A7MYN2_9BURK|nr:hypothetical protein [Rugamonas aquatica]MQA37840.1 hypothetical protein [Rugamonas aquatica]